MIPEEILRGVSKSDALSYTLSLGRMTVWEYLVAKGVALDGHFVFSGGGHGDKYINIRDLDTINSLNPIAMQMAWEMHNTEFDAIIGTPHGADTLAVLVAYYYEQFAMCEVSVLKLLSDGDALTWYKDHGTRVQGLRVLQIEDVINSAGSLCCSTNFIQISGGTVVSFCAVCNRRSDKNPGLSTLAKQFNLQQAIALMEIDVVNHAIDKAYSPVGQCPLCAEGIELDTRVGHGAKFLVQIKDKYPNLYKSLKGE